MKKRRGLLLIIMAALLLFSGCGSGGVGKGEPTQFRRPEAAKVTAEAARPTEPVRVPETEPVPTTAFAPESAPAPETEPVPTTAPASETESVQTTAPVPETEPVPTTASAPETESVPTRESTDAPETEPHVTYIVNTNTGKFHNPSCSSVGQMKEKNTWYFTGTREELLDLGYQPCGRCHP